MFIPFLQIGVSFYLSGATVVALAVLFKFRAQIIASMLSHPMRTLFCCLAFVMPMMYPYEIDGQDIGRAFRETLFLLIMVSAFGAVQESFDRGKVARITTIMYAMIGFYLLLALVQTAFLTRQVYFGIPKGLFIANEGTIPGELDLIYSKLRATGTFGEPSYLGFVMTSFAFALLPLARRWGGPRLAILAVALIALICQSLSFFIAIAMLIAYERPGFKDFKITIILPALLIAIGLGAYFWEVIEHFGDRLTSLSNSAEEPSGFVRIFGPISILPDFLSQYPTGVPFYKLYPILESYVPIGLRPLSFYDNGLINLVLNFGYVGFILLYIYFSSVRDNTSRIYLFVSGIFNGALISPDKLGVMILMLALYNSFVAFSLANGEGASGLARAAATPLPNRRRSSAMKALRMRAARNG